MKISKITVLVAIGSWLMACSGKSEAVFEQVPSERLNLAYDELRSVLMAPAQGWEMIYFKEVAPIFSDRYRNLKGSNPFGFTYIERDYGRGGNYFLVKFLPEGKLMMMGDVETSAYTTPKESDYILTQNTYLQLNFVSPNYIFQTGQSSFLFYQKTEEGNLIFVTNKTPYRDREYIVLRPLSSENSWENIMSQALSTRLVFERRLKQGAVLKIDDNYGDRIFESDIKGAKYIDEKKRYTVFVKNMEPHLVSPTYYAALGSGYVPLQDEVFLLPGIRVNDSISFTHFRLEQGRYVSQEKGFTAIIE